MSDLGVVHIIDDDEAMRASLEFLLGTASLVVSSHDSAETFLEQLSAAQVDCVLTDVRMPGMNGIELLKQLRAESHHVPVVVMTGHGDVPLAVEAMKVGAFDFIEKPFDDEEMITTVNSAIEHWRGLQDRGKRRNELAAALEKLTLREHEVLDGLVEGRPNKTIAYDLGISPRTVEIYRANLMTKLGATSLSDVIRIAFIVRGNNLDSA